MFGDNHRLRKQLRAHGQQAQAEVLEAERRPWKSGHGGGLNVAGFSTASTKAVYRLKLRVSPPDAPAFDVEITDESLEIPQVGMTVAVLFDPKHHSKVVLDLDEMDPFAARRQTSSSQADPRAEGTGAGPARTFAAGPVTAMTINGQSFDLSGHPELSPQIRAIKQQHKGDPAAMNNELLAFFRANGITDPPQPPPG